MRRLAALTAALPRAVPAASQCEICRRWAREALCPDCIAHHAPAQSRCQGCGLRLPGLAPRCAACLHAPPPAERCTCAVDYAFPWDGLVAAFKYHGRAELAGPLAARLHAALDADERAWPELIVPVPLARSRLAERGYNQAWELARRLGRALERPADARLLTRPLDRPHQAELDRAARRRNLRGSFGVAQPQALAGRRVALVDDVLTTGATVAEAARTLLDAGASAVRVWALARTP